MRRKFFVITCRRETSGGQSSRRSRSSGRFKILGSDRSGMLSGSDVIRERLLHRRYAAHVCVVPVAVCDGCRESTCRSPTAACTHSRSLFRPPRPPPATPLPRTEHPSEWLPYCCVPLFDVVVFSLALALLLSSVWSLVCSLLISMCVSCRTLSLLLVNIYTLYRYYYYKLLYCVHRLSVTNS